MISSMEQVERQTVVWPLHVQRCCQLEGCTLQLHQPLDINVWLPESYKQWVDMYKHMLLCSCPGCNEHHVHVAIVVVRNT